MHQLKLHSRMRIYLLFIIHNHSSSSELPELWERNATGGKCQFLTRIAHFVRATQAPQEYLISLVRHFAYFCALRCPSTDHCSEASNLWWRIWIIFHVVYIAAWRIQLSFIQRKTHKTMIMTMIFRKKNTMQARALNSAKWFMKWSLWQRNTKITTQNLSK